MTSELFVIALITVLLIILCIKPLREMFIWFITDIFIPACKFLINYVLLYGIKMFKDILVSHGHIIKNLFVSRAVIFPNNEDLLQERDKAMNRKTS